MPECLSRLFICSEEDEDDDDEDPKQKEEGSDVKPQEDTAVVEGEDGEPIKPKAKAESTELVEYSPDELQDVNKDILNAEITQLEGE